MRRRRHDGLDSCPTPRPRNQVRCHAYRIHYFTSSPNDRGNSLEPIELPHDLKEINEDLQQITTAYNNAVHENNISLAQDLRGKLDKTKATFEEAAKKHSILLGASNVWVEIHNNGWDWLKSRGDWGVTAGDWVSPAVDGWIKPGDTCFLQMTGNWVHGIDAYTYWEWNDGSHPAVTAWWVVYQGSNRAGGYNDGGAWYHTWSGKHGDIVKFYFSQ